MGLPGCAPQWEAMLTFTEIALTLSQIKHLKPASPLFWILHFLFSLHVQSTNLVSKHCGVILFGTCQLNPSRHATPKCSQFRGLQCQLPSCCKGFPLQSKPSVDISFLDVLTFSAVAPCFLRPHPTTKQSLNRQGSAAVVSMVGLIQNLATIVIFNLQLFDTLHPYSSWSIPMVSTSITGHWNLNLRTTQCDYARRLFLILLWLPASDSPHPDFLVCSAT